MGGDLGSEGLIRMSHLDIANLSSEMFEVGLRSSQKLCYYLRMSVLRVVAICLSSMSILFLSGCLAVQERAYSPTTHNGGYGDRISRSGPQINHPVHGVYRSSGGTTGYSGSGYSRDRGYSGRPAPVVKHGDHYHEVIGEIPSRGPDRRYYRPTDPNQPLPPRRGGGMIKPRGGTTKTSPPSSISTENYFGR